MEIFRGPLKYPENAAMFFIFNSPAWGQGRWDHGLFTRSNRSSPSTCVFGVFLTPWVSCKKINCLSSPMLNILCLLKAYKIVFIEIKESYPYFLYKSVRSQSSTRWLDSVPFQRHWLILATCNLSSFSFLSHANEDSMLGQAEPLA